MIHQLRKHKKRQQLAKTLAFSVDEIYFGTIAVHFKRGAGTLDLFELEKYAPEPSTLISDDKNTLQKLFLDLNPYN